MPWLSSRHLRGARYALAINSGNRFQDEVGRLLCDLEVQRAMAHEQEHTMAEPEMPY